MNKQLTVEQATKRYIESGGVACPRCGAEKLTITDDLQPDDGEWTSQGVKCRQCKMTWRDHYHLEKISIDPEFVDGDKLVLQGSLAQT